MICIRWHTCVQQVADLPLHCKKHFALFRCMSRTLKKPSFIILLICRYFVLIYANYNWYIFVYYYIM
jgi:hypothetical protein